MAATKGTWAGKDRPGLGRKPLCATRVRKLPQIAEHATEKKKRAKGFSSRFYKTAECTGTGEKRKKKKKKFLRGKGVKPENKRYRQKTNTPQGKAIRPGKEEGS